MKPIKAFVIYDENNPLSKMYLEKSLESFSNCKSITIEKVQCVTPDTLYDQKFNLNFNDFYLNQKHKGSNKKYNLPERACFASHYSFWLEAAKTRSRFIVLEHDAYLLSNEKFERYLKLLPETYTWNPGLWMECYSLDKDFAQLLTLRYQQTNIEMGPMAEVMETMNLFFAFKRLYSKEKKKTFLFPYGEYGNKAAPVIANVRDPRILYPPTGPGSREFVGTRYASKAVTQLMSVSKGASVNHDVSIKVSDLHNPFGFKLID